MRSEPNRPGAAWRQGLAQSCAAHGAFLFRLAYGILRDTHAAEDACQEAFARVCGTAPPPADPDRLRPWLAKVVVNESLARLRRAKIERRLREQSVRVATTDAAHPPDPFLRQTVLAALEQLPEPSRLVVLLRIMHGWSGNEVRELLGCSAAEVSRRLYAGMEQLRGLLAQGAAAALKDYGYGT